MRANLEAAQSRFASFLSSVDPVSSPRLSLLPPRLASFVHADALRRISEAYSELCDAVLDPKSGYDRPEALLRRSKEEVRTLLVVQ